MTTRGLWWLLGVAAAVIPLTLVGGGLLLLRQVRTLTGPVGIREVTGQPLPSGDKAVVQAQLKPLWIGYYRKNLGDVYDKLGKHDARWDKQARDFLERCAVTYWEENPPPALKRLIPSGLALVKMGCDDPVVLMVTSDLLRRENRLKEARSLAERSVPGLKRPGYPPLDLAWAYLTLADCDGEVGSSLESADFKWRPLAIDAYVAAADKRNFGPQEQRALWWELESLMETGFRRSQARIVTTLNDRPNTDPWILNMAYGKHRYDFAWLARGPYTMDKVTQEGYAEFTRLAGRARDHYVKAYQAHPEYPEASARLTDIAKTGAVPGMEGPRTWFDRTVAAQFDFMPVYYTYMSALQPRWSGSHEAMLSFAQECVDTRRFDTTVPQIYYETVLMIAERDRDASVWERPEVWPGLQQFCEGRLAWALKNDHSQVKQLRTLYALIAWRAKHPEMARQQLEALHGQIDQQIFDLQWTERSELFVGMIYGLTGPRKEQVRRAEDLYATEKVDEALTAYQALLKTETEKPAVYFLRDRIQSLRWEKQFQANEWVNLDPTPQLAGWNIWQGKYVPLPDGKGFRMTPGSRFGMMSCQMRPGRWFEIRCDVEFPHERVKGIEAGFIVGIPLTGNPYYDSCRIIQNPPQCTFGMGWTPTRERALSKVQRKCHLRLVQCDKRVTMYLDEETVLQDQELTQQAFSVEGPHYLAIGGESWPDPTKPVIYRNIQIHKLSTDPIKSR